VIDSTFGVAVGVAVGVAIGVGAGFFMGTPLFQTNFLPDFMQVKTLF
jgi:ABC-type nitrate/sulfonate/bicarbonate transport system permease component